MKKFSFQKISEHRTLLMGLEIVLIMFFHFTEDCKETKSGFSGFVSWFFTYIRSSGVDIFLLLSGFGLYYSWKKQPKALPFYRKRLTRVLVPYLIVGVLAWGWLDLYLGRTGVRLFLADLSFVTLFTRGTKLFWYIFLCLVCYLIFPLAYRLFDDRRTRQEEATATAGVFLLCTAAVFFARNHWKDLYPVLNLLLLRFPFFILGIWIGKLAAEDKGLPAWAAADFMLLSLVLAIHLHSDPVWGRYALAALNCSICMLVIMILDATAVSGFPFRDYLTDMLCWCGRHSLELYLIHVAVRKVMKKYGYSPSVLHNELTLIAASLVGAALLYRLVSGIQKHGLAKANSDSRRN